MVYKSSNYLFLFLLSIFSISLIFAGTSDYAYILSVDSHTVYPESVYPNSEVSLTITLSNISQISDAENIVITLHPNTEYIESIKASDKLNVIKFNQTGTSVLRFKVKPNTPGGDYSIPFTIEYGVGQKVTIESQVNITVLNYSKLNVVLDNYPKSNIYLDEVVNLSGKIKNEGNTTLTGVNVLLNYSGKIVPLSEGSVFVGDVMPGESIPYTFSIKIPKTADIGIYDLNVYANDVSSNTDTEKFSLVVEDVPSLIISSLDKSIEGDKTFLAQADKFSLSIQLENTSKSKAKSVSIKLLNLSELGLEGTDLAYVGSIDATDSGAGVFDLSVLSNAEVGNKHLKFQVIYSDEFDLERTMNSEISLLVSKKASSNSGWFFVIFLIIVGSVGYYFYKNKQKTKKIKNL